MLPTVTWQPTLRSEILIGVGATQMVEKRFSSVWYLPDENTWRNFRMLAFRDTGTLVVGEDSLDFDGKKEHVQITAIRRISYGKA